MAKSKKTKKTKVAAGTKEDPLEAALAEIDEEYGEGALQVGGGTFVSVDAISTGILNVDIISGCGGLPKGRIVEVYGNESSGKTTFILRTIGSCQKVGGRAAFIDAEHAMDPEWAMHNGVDMKSLLISQPDSGDEALNIVEALVRHGACDLVVVDSVAALIPKSELDGDIGDPNVGAQARLMSQAMRKLTGITGKTKTSVVFINQLREKIGGFSMFGTPESTPGGRALKFYSSIRIELKKSSTIKENETPIGASALVKIVKNKVAPPFRSTKINIHFGSRAQKPEPMWAIDLADAMIDGAMDVGAMEVRGSNYYFDGEKLAVGRANVAGVLRSDASLYQKIYDKSLSLIRPNVEAKDKVDSISDRMTDTDD